MSLARTLLDSGLPPDTDPAILRHHQLVNVSSLALVVVGVPFVMQYFLLGVPVVAAGIGATIIGGALNMWWLRRTHRAARAGIIATSLLYGLLLLSNLSSGGFSDPNFAWFYVVPIVGALLVSPRVSLGFTLLWGSRCSSSSPRARSSWPTRWGSRCWRSRPRSRTLC